MREISSYTGLFPPNSTFICIMVALIYNGVLLGRARGGTSSLARLAFHQRNFLVPPLSTPSTPLRQE